MDQQEVLQLVEKYLEGRASTQEIEMLHAYYDSFQQPADWDVQQLGDKVSLEQQMLERLQQSIRSSKTPVVTKLYRGRLLTAAAVIFILLTAGIFYFIQSGKQPAVHATAKTATTPGDSLSNSKAVLTLASGEQIALDAAANGKIAAEAGSSIYNDHGKLTYETSNTKAVATTSNTLATRKGGEYMIVLPDGTRVWLNAATELRFPSVFTGDERKVQLKGEAYFEVTKNAAMPFKVAVTTADGKEKAMVEVLGTHFNISGYEEEEALQTTLLEGSVKLMPVANHIPLATNAKTLVPGQQGIISQKGDVHNIKIATADIDAVMAWKNGLFNFNDADITTIMRQVARWYDVEVIYEGTIPDRIFSGKINRSTDITQVLAILEQSDIHFERKDGKIIVKP